MTHNEKVASYKAYLQTGDPQFIPAVYEKTAHVNEVQAWKDRWTASAGYEKEARAGHPANVALARALSPGILPGMNSGGSKVHASHNGDFNHDIASFIEEGVDPGTQAYLRGEKTAVKRGPDRSGKPPAPSKPEQPNRSGNPPAPSKPPLPEQPNSKDKKMPATKAYPGAIYEGLKPGRPDLPPGHPDLPNPPPQDWKERGSAGKEVTAAIAEQPQGGPSLSDMLRKFVAQQK